jgi:hypothetical protein
MLLTIGCRQHEFAATGHNMHQTVAHDLWWVPGSQQFVITDDLQLRFRNAQQQADAHIRLALQRQGWRLAWQRRRWRLAWQRPGALRRRWRTRQHRQEQQ